jgi:hypothetical protein
LLFYNTGTGQADFYTCDASDTLTPMAAAQWSPNHTHIVPGLFGGLETDLVFYAAATNTVSVLFEFQGNLNPLVAGDLPFGTWTHIIPGIYSDSGYTDLLFYDVDLGIGSFYRSETPVEWRTGLVQGYAGAISVFPGEMLSSHVSSDAGSFELDIFRRGMNEHSLCFTRRDRAPALPSMTTRMRKAAAGHRRSI